MNPKVS